MCSNVDLSSRFLEFVLESKQRPRVRHSRAQTNYAGLILFRISKVTIVIWRHFNIFFEIFTYVM